MTRRLVDPVHFFDSHGRSMLTRKVEEQRIAELEAENLKLKQLLTRTVQALKGERAKSRERVIAN
ncbi:hypothetical protein [Shinella zoogloeoides]|uniref:hypothetical protein n=1 Tax=Shinella zoogloeoides TaxID=352475 RepID=UPI00273F30CB|nr:hypothetical protein [Shinella zoogloeoides]WLR90978.1 hypothetical protein Q9316_00080 [Shinella zoogloeoides]